MATAPSVRRKERRRGWEWSVVAAVIVLVIGLWTDHAVRESIDTHIQGALETILEGDRSAIEQLVALETEDIALWSRQADVREATSALVDAVHAADDMRSVLLEHDMLSELQSALQALAHQRDIILVAVVDPEGTVLCTTRSEFRGVIGRQLTSRGMQVLDGLRDDRATFGQAAGEGPLAPGTPIPKLSTFVGVAPITRHEHPAGVAAPTVAMLMVFRDMTADFDQLLLKNSLDGDTYALDRSGHFITPPGQAVFSELGLSRAADPGVNLTQVGRAETSPDTWPLTHMARELGQGRDGIDLDGYRNHLGQRVVGAWCWLPDLDLGLATELTVAGARSARRPMRIAFGVLLLIVAAAGLFAVVASRRIRRLERQVSQLGQYTLQDKIGEGGMGVVYLARHALLARLTAVKLLKPDASDDESVGRFEREVQITSQLQHPNTIEIYDYGRTEDGRFFYAMEYLPGLTITDLIQIGGALPVGRTIAVLRQVCGSLIEAHGAGLIHRDIKPLNVIVSYVDGVGDLAKVLDFGLVKDVVGDWDVTETQSISGTPAYMAPERMSDPGNPDPRSDLYAVGVMAFNMLTGEDPFTGNSAMEILYKAANDERPSPSAMLGEALPARLEALVVGAMACKPEDRPASAEEMLAVLEELSHEHHWTAADADRWWVEHAPEVERLRPGATTGGDASHGTIARL